jgi:hypothetical protein
MATHKAAAMQIGVDDMVGACLVLPRSMRTWLRLQAAALTDTERARVTQSEVVRRLIDADPVYAVWLQEQSTRRAAK